jgi:hypothetical protein
VQPEYEAPPMLAIILGVVAGLSLLLNVVLFAVR